MGNHRKVGINSLGYLFTQLNVQLWGLLLIVTHHSLDLFVIIKGFLQVNKPVVLGL